MVLNLRWSETRDGGGVEFGYCEGGEDSDSEDGRGITGETGIGICIDVFNFGYCVCGQKMLKSFSITTIPITRWNVEVIHFHKKQGSQ